MSGDLSALAGPPAPQATINHPSMLRKELLYFISDTIEAHPRSQQRRIGPSEVGTPCLRKLGYKLSGTTPVNSAGDQWRATVGTAVHTWLAEMLERANRMLGVKRFLIEQRVTPGQIGGEPFTGSCDCYDTETQIVVDWKVPGPATMKSVKGAGPSITYQTQAHVYGLGWSRRGYPVQHVALAFLPAAGNLSDNLWWSEPYDRDKAQAAIDRAHTLSTLLDTAGPELLAQLPTTSDYCSWCPWYRRGVNNPAVACDGQLRSRPDGPETLIAPRGQS